MATGTTTLLNVSGEKHSVREYGSESEMGYQAIVKWVPSTSYDTGGSLIDLSALFQEQVIFAIVFSNGTKFLPVYVPSTNGVPSTGKVKIVDSTSGSEVASTIDLSAQTYFVMARGR